MKNSKLIVILGIVVIAAVIFWPDTTKKQYIESIRDPQQSDMTAKETRELEGKNITVELLAKYNIEAIVKSKKKYSDYSSKISKYDLALAWGTLNSKENDAYIRYNQSGRWYYYRIKEGASITQDYVADHSANTHIIPADKGVASQIKKINKNDHILLDGYLINVLFENGNWKSSLTREDSGDGACEVMLVEKVEIIE